MTNARDNRISRLDLDSDAPVAAVPAPKAPVTAPTPSPAPAAPTGDLASNIRDIVRESGPIAQPAPVVHRPVSMAQEEQFDRSKLIAVSLPDEVTGAVVYWSLNGAVNLDKFRNAWINAGLNPAWLPKTPSAEVALSRAVKEFASSTCLVRKHPKGGWALVTETRKDETLDYSVGVRIRLENDKIMVTPPKNFEFESAVLIGNKVRADFDRIRTEVSTTDISGWLVGLMTDKLNAVPLRETGGMYFVPRQSIETLRALTSALESATNHTVYEIPAMQSSQAVRSVFDAVQREMLTVVEKTESALATADFGSRAARARAEECQDMIKKVESYEALLSKPMPETKDRIRALIKKLNEYGSRTSALDVTDYVTE